MIVQDGNEYPQLLPEEQSFVVDNLYSDFKRHDLGPAFHERNYDGTLLTETITEPLWGVGSTAPYGHDGRSINLEEVILRHGGEAQASKDAFVALDDNDQRKLIEFLQTLVLFPPDDTASNLNAGDSNESIQDPAGHGNINLGALFQIADLGDLPRHVDMEHGKHHNKVRWFGSRGETYHLQQSMDLIQWDTVMSTNLVYGSMVEFELPMNDDQCYYRVQQE